MSTSLAGKSILDATSELRAAHAQAAAPNYERYRRDPFAHADDGHVAILDLVTQRTIPYLPYPHQREAAANWIDLERLAVTGELRFFNFLWEKSRQVGGTWSFALMVWWMLTYHDKAGGIIHRKLGEIYAPGLTPDSFFGKVKFIHDARHPAPPGETGDLWMPQQYRSPLKFVGGNDPIIYNQSFPRRFFIGEGATTDPTRGGTYDYFILDEAARIPWGESVQAAITRSTPQGRVYLSTPHGKGNVYYRLLSTRPAGLNILRHHWSVHPVYSVGLHVSAQPARIFDGEQLPPSHSPQPTTEAAGFANACQACLGTMAGLRWDPAHPDLAHRYHGKLVSPWYDLAVVELTDMQVATELDIDYSASLAARVYPEFSIDVHALPTIDYDPAIPLELCWDYGLDTTAVGILQDGIDSVRMIGEVELGDMTPEQIVAAVVETCRALGVQERELALRDQWLAVGDPSGEGRELSTANPLILDYRRHGFNIVARRYGVSTTINAVKRLLQGKPKPFRISAAGCPRTIDHFEGNVWPTDREGRRKTGAPKPLDNIHNHMCGPAGTLVLTDQGERPIETVMPGDLVLTRGGWRPVSHSGPTGIDRVTRLAHERGELCLTDSHPVWVHGQGWVDVRDLDTAMSVYVVGEPAELPGVVVERGECSVAGVADQTSDLAGGVIVVDVQHRSPIELARSTVRGATADETQSPLRFDHRQILGERDPVLAAKPVVAALVDAIPRVRGHLAGPEFVPASETADRVRAGAGVPRAFDRRAAVDARTRLMGFPTHPSRILDVEPDALNGECLVFNLTVAGDWHEYFANGLLVSNCRALAYWASYKWPPPDERDSIYDATAPEDPDIDDAGHLPEYGSSWDMRL